MLIVDKIVEFPSLMKIRLINQVMFFEYFKNWSNFPL